MIKSMFGCKNGGKKFFWIFSVLVLGVVGLWLSGFFLRMVNWAGVNGKPTVVSQGREADSDGKSPSSMSLQMELVLAVEKGDLTLLQKALRSGANPNDSPQNHSFPLKTALRRKDVEATRLLLDSGADPNIASDHLQGTPLFIAVDQGDKESVMLLLKAGADPCYIVESDTPASWARKKGYKEIVFILWAASPCLIPRMD